MSQTTDMNPISPEGTTQSSEDAAAHSGAMSRDDDSSDGNGGGGYSDFMSYLGAPAPAHSSPIAAAGAVAAAETDDDQAISGLENAPIDDNIAPVPPAQLVASYEGIDEEMGINKKHAGKKPEIIDDDHDGPPMPSGQIVANIAEEGIIDIGKTAKGNMLEMIDHDDDYHHITAVEEGGGAEQKGNIATKMTKQAEGGSGGSSSNRGQTSMQAPGSTLNNDQTEQVTVPPPQSIVSNAPLTNDNETPSTRPSTSEAVPTLEATLVQGVEATLIVEGQPSTQQPVYEATMVRNEEGSVEGSKVLPWWKKRQTCLILVAGIIAIVLGVSLGRSGTAADTSENKEQSDNTPEAFFNQPYYAVWEDELCDDDPNGLPNINLGQRLFETPEECCQTEFWHLQDDECIINSLPDITRAPTSSPIEEPKATIQDPTGSPSTIQKPTSSPSIMQEPTGSPTTTSQMIQSTGLKLFTTEDVLSRDTNIDHPNKLVAVYGDTVVVGAPFNDNKQGAVFVLAKDENGDWFQQAKLTAPDKRGGNKFGSAVGIYEDTIIVGSDGDDDGSATGTLSQLAGATGSAHVFIRQNNSWVHQAKLLAPDGDEYDFFGTNVDIYDNTVIIGGWGDDDKGRESGSAHIFVRNGSEWTHQAKLIAPDTAEWDYFGRSVDIYDNTAIIGAYKDDDNGATSGSAHVFVREGTAWVHQAKLLPPDGYCGNYFGYSVSIYEDTIVVGSYNDDDEGSNSGTADVFVRIEDEWAHQAKLLAPDAAADDKFGYSVAIHHNGIIVGSLQDDDDSSWDGTNTGSSHLFVRNGATWEHQAKLIAPDGENRNDYFGSSVAIHQNSVVVGSGGSGETFIFMTSDNSIHSPSSQTIGLQPSPRPTNPGPTPNPTDSKEPALPSPSPTGRSTNEATDIWDF